MILKLSTCNRRSLLCICVCRAWSHNIFQFFVALLKNFPTSSNSLKNAMIPYAEGNKNKIGIVLLLYGIKFV